ncbi:SGNH/GDSL hydrolase family protein [Gemmata obscuriglobus]|uniref:SGNH/GDSL hydrolase family protein n=1 Tax=Gemmata obscuriglobus TaxID=114 RepID=A0A2Z3H5V0_9BACT|nr:SGNH/GDSL hydrolase family protein [Gemmata obscuriglobus]
MASGTGTAAGTSAASGEGTSIISRPVVCVTPGDYFSYICLDRRADKAVGSGTAAGTSTVTGVGSAGVAGTGTAAGTSTATGETSGSIVSGTGTAAGTSTATGYGTSEAPYVLQIVGTPKVIYSDIRPAGYSGNTFRITRESDGLPFEVGFKANGLADYEAADAFAPLGWRRHTQYDLSGNGFHQTVPAGVQAPKDFGNTICGLRSLTFNGPGTTQALANLSVPWTDVRNTTFMAVIKTANQGIFEVGNPTRKMSLAGVQDAGINWSGIQAQYAVTSPQVLVAAGNGAANRVLRQNHRVVSAPALASSAATGLTLSNAIGYASPGNVDLLCLVGYDSVFSAPDQIALQDTGFAAVREAIPRAAHDVIAAHGDSILAGNSRTANLSYETLWFSRLMSATTRPFTWYNCGHGGYTVTQLLAVAPAVAAACYDPLGENTAILAGGSNDLAAGATADATYAKIVQWANIWYAQGFVRVHVIDEIPRKAIFSGGADAASFETQRQLLMAKIAAGVGVDFAGASSPGTHPVLGDPANCNGTNFLDLVHPNAVGNGHYFDAVEASTAYFRT